MDILFWVLLFLSFIIFTYLMKILFKAQTWYIASMIKSKKLAKVLDKFKYKRFWEFVSKSGIFLGFGFLGIYYWYHKDFKKKNTILKIILWQLFVLFFAFLMSLFMIKGLGLTNAIILFFVTGLTGLSGFALYALGYYSVKILIKLFLGQHTCPGVAPVIPGVKIPGIPINIPFFAGWLALIVILILHEFSHGVLARIIKIKVKSFGLVLLGFFPIGAFTEPDEDALLKAKPKNQLKVFSSGPMINFYLAILAFLLAGLLALGTNNYMINTHANLVDGVFVQSKAYTGMCNSGVESINQKAFLLPTKVLSINGKKTNDLNKVLFVLNKAKKDINKSVDFEVLNDENKIIHNDLNFNSDGLLGINISVREKPNKPLLYRIISFLSEFLHWLFLLSLMVAIFNFLPTEPFDGGKMTKIILSEFIFTRFEVEKRYKMIGFFFGILILLLIIINILPWFF